MKDLLLNAAQEIESLRRRNEVLSAKVEVMDLFAFVLHTSPATRESAQCVDVAWQLREQVDVLSKRDEKDPTQAIREEMRKRSGALYRQAVDVAELEAEELQQLRQEVESEIANRGVAHGAD